MFILVEFIIIVKKHAKTNIYGRIFTVALDFGTGNESDVIRKKEKF